MGELTFNEEEKFKAPPSYHKEKTGIKKVLYNIGFGQKINPRIIVFLVITLSIATIVAIYDASRDMLNDNKNYNDEIKSYLPEDNY